MVKIAITGSSGLIGSRVIELLKNDFIFIPLDSSIFDITDRQKVSSALQNLEFDIFFHLAAYTNVDKAEIERERAQLVNVEGTRTIFEEVQKKNKKFIYVSTDFVFDGKDGPYFEDSQPNPIGYYAKTKYEGELVVKDKAMIVRLSYPYRKDHPGKSDFVQRLRDQLSNGNPVKLISDSLITPTFIDDIAFAMKYLFANFKPEIYHIVGADSVSPLQAGRLIAETFDLRKDLISSTTFEEYSKGKAIRSQYSNIKSRKNNFHTMKAFREGLESIK